MAGHQALQIGRLFSLCDIRSAAISIQEIVGLHPEGVSFANNKGIDGRVVNI